MAETERESVGGGGGKRNNNSIKAVVPTGRLGKLVVFSISQDNYKHNFMYSIANTLIRRL